MRPDEDGEVVALPPAGGRRLRTAAGVVLVFGGLLQTAVGIQIGRPTTVVAGAVVAAMGALLVVRAGRGATLGPDGVHDPIRLRNQHLPWTEVASVLLRPASAGRVRLLVEPVPPRARDEPVPPRARDEPVPPRARDEPVPPRARDEPVASREREASATATPLRIATLSADAAETLLPRVVRLAEANDVRVIDRR